MSVDLDALECGIDAALAEVAGQGADEHYVWRGPEIEVLDGLDRAFVKEVCDRQVFILGPNEGHPLSVKMRADVLEIPRVFPDELTVDGIVAMIRELVESAVAVHRLVIALWGPAEMNGKTFAAGYGAVVVQS